LNGINLAVSSAPGQIWLGAQGGICNFRCYIGLTVARELIVANGGSLDVESTGPGGTTMRLSLPGVAPQRN